MRGSLVAGAAGLALLTAACSATATSAQGPRGAATSTAFRQYGRHAYRLGAEERDYSAELIVRQVPGGIAVLAAGYTLNRSQGLWNPALTITFHLRGDRLYHWALPVWPHYTTDYASGYRRVCIPRPSADLGGAIREYVDAGCTHPVFKVDVAANAGLTAESANTGERYVLTSAGIILLPQSRASSGQ
jgi:hypothetical protein